MHPAERGPPEAVADLPSGLHTTGYGRRRRGAAPRPRADKLYRVRSRLYRNENLQENTRFSAFFKIYQIIQLKILKFGNILQILQHLQNFC